MANDFTDPGDFTSSGIDAPGSSAPGSPANDQIEKTAAWIAADENAPTGCGRIMFKRPGGAADEPDPVAAVPAGFSFLKKIIGVLAPDSPNVAGNIAIKSESAANDNVVWVGDEDDNGGVYGSDVDAATLADGGSVVAWIGPDRVVHAKYYPADGDGAGASAEESAARAEHAGQFNELLADLGGAGQRAGSADGRVKVTSYGQGGVAALWIADFGFTAALMGKLYMLQQDPSGDSSSDRQSAQAVSWTVKDISPVVVPRHASNISVDISEDGQISVSYLSEPGDGGSMFAVTVASGDASRDELVGSDEGDLLAPEAEALDLQVPHGSSGSVQIIDADAVEVSGTERENAEATSGAANDQGPAPNDDGGGSFSPNLPDDFGDIELFGTPVTVAGGAGDGVAQSQPQVVVTPGGTIVPLHLEPGTEPGTAVIKLTPLGSNGQPITNADGEPVVTVVSDHALVQDEEKPYLELDPSLAVVGGGVGVAFVTETSVGETAVYQLNVQVFDGEATAISDAPTVVALASDPETTYSDFDVGGIGSNGHSEDDDAQGSQESPEGDQQGSSGVQVAVVWVENADESGYGSIMGQRFGVIDREGGSEGNSGSDESGDNSGSGNAGHHDGEGGAGGQVLVALGLDGSADSSGGIDDATFQIPFETAEEVIGRAPQVSGCGDDGIAVAWVQESSPGSGVEVVAGTVLQVSGGNSLLAINLTGLISNGILKGTEPTLLSDDDGDIVIGWVQSGSSGLYEAAVAVYRAIEAGGWTVPDAAIVLQTFDSEPRNLDFGLQGGDDPTILLSWSSSGSRVSGARFDFDGNQEGSVFRIRGDDNDNGSEGDVSVAGLADGHIVVVYTQTDGDDTDIGAVIVQTVPSSAGDGDGDNSGSGSGASEQNQDSGSTQVAIIATTPSQPEIDPTGTGGDADAATSLVVLDLESDLIRVYGSAVSYSSGSTSSTSGSSSNSGSGSANSGSGSGGDGGSFDYAANDDDDVSGNRGSGSSGGGSSGSGSGKDTGETLAFAVGYGNDAADYYEDEHVFDIAEPIADMFDALQFANALSDNGNGEVIVFEASNIVVIRDFETL